MKRLMRIGIFATGTLVCEMIVKYIRYPDSVIVCLAVAVTIATINGLFQMCDHLLDQPPTIFRLMCANPKFISPMPPHDLQFLAHLSKD